MGSILIAALLVTMNLIIMVTMPGKTPVITQCIAAMLLLSKLIQHAYKL